MQPLKRFLEEFLLMIFALLLFPLVAGSPLALLIFALTYPAFPEFKKILLGEAALKNWNWNALTEPLLGIGGTYLCFSGILFVTPTLLPLVFFANPLWQLLSVSLFYSMMHLFFIAIFLPRKSDQLEENRETTLSSQPSSRGLPIFIGIIMLIVLGAFILPVLKPVASIIVGSGFMIMLKRCLTEISDVVSIILTPEPEPFRWIHGFNRHPDELIKSLDEKMENIPQHTSPSPIQIDRANTPSQPPRTLEPVDDIDSIPGKSLNLRN